MEPYKKALMLAYLTIGYNVIEAAVSLVAGGYAGSIALVGFGLDSVIESLSGIVIVWRINRHGRLSEEDELNVENKAGRVIGLTFFVLAAYILFESTEKLVAGEGAAPSVPGMIIASASLVVMPLLARAKYALGKSLGLKSLVADSKETAVCAVLSFALLAGLVANALFRIWYLDSVLGIVIAIFCVKEGFELVIEREED